MASWFGAHYNQEVGFSSAVKCKKGPFLHLTDEQANWVTEVGFSEEPIR